MSKQSNDRDSIRCGQNKVISEQPISHIVSPVRFFQIGDMYTIMFQMKKLENTVFNINSSIKIFLMQAVVEITEVDTVP